jgi:CheY-like chemotaxis protein
LGGLGLQNIFLTCDLGYSNLRFYGGLSVLICIEHADTRRMVRQTLLGFNASEVREAASPADVLRHLHANRRLHVGLIDGALGGNALRVVRAIRLAPQSPRRDLPILLMTHQPTPELIAAARDAGVDDLIAKPFTTASFFAKLDDVVRRPRTLINAESYFGPDRRRLQRAFKGPDRRKQVADVVIKPVAPPRDLGPNASSAPDPDRSPSSDFDDDDALFL